MILTCDVGNTNIKTAIFHGDVIGEIRSFDNQNTFFNYIENLQPENIAIASVVPSATEIILDFIKTNIGIIPLIISKDLRLNLAIDYESSETLGIDRICSAEGAFKLFKNSRDFNKYSEKTYLITIDFGTATTINIIRYPGIFSGGLIAPGINMMFNALSQNTAQLPIVNGNDFKLLIGKDTKTSIASGVINSILGMIEKTLKYLIENFNADYIRIFITGGNAEKIIPHIDNIDFENQKALVLIGVKAIFDNNS